MRVLLLVAVMFEISILSPTIWETDGHPWPANKGAVKPKVKAVPPKKSHAPAGPAMRKKAPAALAKPDGMVEATGVKQEVTAAEISPLLAERAEASASSDNLAQVVVAAEPAPEAPTVSPNAVKGRSVDDDAWSPDEQEEGMTHGHGEPKPAPAAEPAAAPTETPTEPAATEPPATEPPATEPPATEQTPTEPPATEMDLPMPPPTNFPEIPDMEEVPEKEPTQTPSKHPPLPVATPHPPSVDVPISGNFVGPEGEELAFAGHLITAAKVKEVLFTGQGAPQQVPLTPKDKASDSAIPCPTLTDFLKGSDKFWNDTMKVTGWKSGLGVARDTVGLSLKSLSSCLLQINAQITALLKQMPPTIPVKHGSKQDLPPDAKLNSTMDATKGEEAGGQIKG